MKTTVQTSVKTEEKQNDTKVYSNILLVLGIGLTLLGIVTNKNKKVLTINNN